jgi:fatty-acyl-CoA synthase
MHSWAKRLVAGLINSGVKPGDHVALLMANFPEFIAIKFAISMVGAVAVPINFLNKRDELGYVLKQSDAVMLITMDSFRDLPYLKFLDELAPDWEVNGGGLAFPLLKHVLVFTTGEACDEKIRKGLVTLDQFGTGVDFQSMDHPGPFTPSDIIYTSGTTGFPKGVILTHNMMLRTAFGSAWARGFEDGRRILFHFPSTMCTAMSKVCLHACLWLGPSFRKPNLTPQIP